MKSYGWVWVVGLLVTSTVQARTMNDQANQEFQAGNWQAAIGSYELLIAKDADNGAYWQRLGLSHLNLERYTDAIDALSKAATLSPEGGQRNRAYLALARAYAVTDDRTGMLIQLNNIVEAGGTPYLAVLNASEFHPFEEDESFQSVVKRLRPCQSDEHRSFDFWLGEWWVTSPGRDGWQARSSITLGNGGCSIHEAYATLGGYAGSSVNFFDAGRQQWHQTWVDNQGGALYLNGGYLIDEHPDGRLQNGAMVLSDGANRITWTLQSDGRVRQHWQVTNNDGESYATSFDGYYEKRQKVDAAID